MFLVQDLLLFTLGVLLTARLGFHSNAATRVVMCALSRVFVASKAGVSKITGLACEVFMGSFHYGLKHVGLHIPGLGCLDTSMCLDRRGM